MDKVCEELHEAKFEIENLRADLICKLQLSEGLKKSNSEQLIRIRHADLKIEKQAEDLNTKENELSALRQMNDQLTCRLNERESTVKRLSAANEKLKADHDEKCRIWEVNNKGLLLDLDEASEKNVDQEQRIHMLMAELEGLKRSLSVSEKKCLEAHKQVKAFNELRARDDVFLKLEDDNQKLGDQLKWKKEQFKHLEEAHEKVVNQFRTCEKEWEKESLALVDEISSLQSRLDSQSRISEDLQCRLKNCNQALAQEDSRRKYLEIELSEFKTRFENVFTESQDAKSLHEVLITQRDKDIAALRHSLGTKETFLKEMKYQTGKLEQENKELIESLRKLQKAGIHEAGDSSSVGKLRNRLRSMEKIHKECSANLKAKEARWSSWLDKTTAELNEYRADLESKDAAVKELKLELEGCNTSMIQLKLQNEEISIFSLVLKLSISEARMSFQNPNVEMLIRDGAKEENWALLRLELEDKSHALSRALIDVEEEREKVASLLKRLEYLELVEGQQLKMQKELQRYKDMLEESSRIQLCLKEKYLQKEIDLSEKLKVVCDDFDMVNLELSDERNKVATLSRRIECFHITEKQCDVMQKELEKCREKLEESVMSQALLEEQVLMMDSDFKEKLKGITKALDTANSELNEERKKAACLRTKVESLELVQDQLLETRKEVERHRELIEESSRCQLRLNEQALQIESESKLKLKEVYDALNVVENELAEERKKIYSLLRRIESLELTEDQLCLLQKELERNKKKLEESSRYKIYQDQQILLMKRLSNDKLREVNDALDKANSELDAKTCAAHEFEFELWIWKCIVQRFKNDIEDLQQLKKELEASLLAQVVGEESIKKEKEGLVEQSKEKQAKVEYLQQQIVMLNQKIEKEHSSCVSAVEAEKVTMEQELLRREFEAVVFAETKAERRCDHLGQLVKGKDEQIDGFMQLVKWLEEKNSSLIEKQKEINEVWAAAKVLDQVEIEEKKLIIVEMEGTICNIQQKLEWQGNDLSHTKQQAVEMDSLVRYTKQQAVEMDSLVRYTEGLSDRISIISSEDAKLMGHLGRILEFVNNGNGVFDDNPMKENVWSHSSQLLNKLDLVSEQRCPFRELN